MSNETGVFDYDEGKTKVEKIFDNKSPMAIVSSGEKEFVLRNAETSI